MLRDFPYIDNAVNANLLASSAENIGGQTSNIACGEQITLNRVVEDLRVETGRDFDPVYAEERPHELRHSLADVSRAREKLGYEPLVDFRRGLERTYRYYRNEGPRPRSTREFARTALELAPPSPCGNSHGGCRSRRARAQ